MQNHFFSNKLSSASEPWCLLDSIGQESYLTIWPNEWMNSWTVAISSLNFKVTLQYFQMKELWWHWHYKSKYDYKSDRFFILKNERINENIMIMHYACFLRNLLQIKRQYRVLICMQFNFQISISMQHTDECPTKCVTLCAGKYHVQRGDTGQQRWDTSAQRACCSALLTDLAAKTHASSFPLAFSAAPFFPNKTKPISEC